MLIFQIEGITEAKKIAAMCETHYIDVVPHGSGGACKHCGLQPSEFRQPEDVLEGRVAGDWDLG